MSEKMPSWEEWNEQLTEEQRNYSLYKILDSMEKQFCNRDIICQEHHDRIKKLENRKLIDRVASGFGGIIGGCAAALGLKILR